MPVSATAALDADAGDVFALITDPRHLPEWNRIMTRVVDAPEKVDVGETWTVEFHALGQSWRSVSTATNFDRGTLEFAYRSGTDDGNPSYADWTWTVTPSGPGCVVTVTADLHPQTFWRRVVLAKIRARQLKHELAESLENLEAAVVRQTNP